MQDLTMIRTQDLPPGCEHVELPAAALPDLWSAHHAGRLRIVGGVVMCKGTVYTTVWRGGSATYVKSRNAAGPAHRPEPRPWARPVAIACAVAAGIVAITYGVAVLIRAATSAVSQSGPALGFLLAVAFLLLGIAWVRRRSGRTVEVTTVTRVRVR